MPLPVSRLGNLVPQVPGSHYSSTDQLPGVMSNAGKIQGISIHPMLCGFRLGEWIETRESSEKWLEDKTHGFGEAGKSRNKYL